MDHNMNGDLRESGPSPESIVAQRQGDVLIKHTILKSDHFPGCQNKKLLPLIEGAPNFRQVPGLPVYGVAIPTVGGLRLVLDQLQAMQGQRKVLWHNMREEPVLYINGNPHVVREANKPFANLEYTGIQKSRVEDMEERLKADVLREAALYGNQIMVAHENDDFQVVEKWEAVTEVDVQTPLEVYQELKEAGYDVDYMRVPVTDEKAPKEHDFTLLIQRLWTLPEGAALVFNCQMGRGRTTTGMIIASLLHIRRKHGSLNLPPAPQGGLPSWFQAQPGAASPARTTSSLSQEEELRAGKYGVIRSLLRVLDDGASSKALLDTVIDACNAMQNLREAIAGYRARLLHEGNDVKRNALLQVCLEYLERYYVLIAFTSYLFDPAFSPDATQQISFGRWMRRRPELQSVLQRLLRRNPLAAMSLHKPISRPPSQALLGTIPYGMQPVDEDEQAEEATAWIVANRTGAVLGAHAILKEDHFPGCQSSKIPRLIPGAPNFRPVPGQNVYGSALPTIDGIRAMLAHVQAAPDSPGKARAIWHNMREEPVIYINGAPFVLREDERPFKNLQEYTGIDFKRLEQMELRLKNDILQESKSYSGKILVAREAERHTDHGSAAEVLDLFEPVADPQAVQTPKEVYQALKGEGYRVDYHRVPLTDGVAPGEAAFDMFFEHLKDARAGDPLVFNCQMGSGRTTTGMVIGCLIRMHTAGNGQLTELPEGQLVGCSPRSIMSEDYVAGMSDDEEVQLEPEDGASPEGRVSETGISYTAGPEEDPLEASSLRDGDYVAVRRFTRILERGIDAKQTVDALIDRCGSLVNLRAAIMRYRKPRRSFRFFRPEINVRDAAFKRGIAYLERYCMLIAFTVYLQRTKQMGMSVTFRDWIHARPDVLSARNAIYQNPAGALAPVPLYSLPPAALLAEHQGSQEVSAEEQRAVLSKRQGSTLSRRSILKSYHAQSGPTALQLPGVPNLRMAKGLPVFTVGSISVQGMRSLLAKLGATPGGQVHVVVSDLREELVAYVNGTPYLRRELEMPHAALHHAGIQAVKLEELERRLRADMTRDAAQWGGKVLLHREVQLPLRSRSPSMRPPHHAGPTAAPRAVPGRASPLQLVSEVQAAASSGQQPAGDGMQDAGDDEAGDQEVQVDEEDITRREDEQPDAFVTAFWEQTGEVGDMDTGLATPLEVYQGLAAEGYQISYRRVPLSRERTPEAADLDVLHQQLMMQPVGQTVAHLILSRSATGSSCRFVAVFACAFLQLTRPSPLATGLGAAGSGSMGSLSSLGDLHSFLEAQGSVPSGLPPSRRPYKAASRLGPKRGGNLAEQLLEEEMHVVERSASSLGEYRGIMNLCRVLPNGTDAKEVVDDAIDMTAAIGNIRGDIHSLTSYCHFAIEMVSISGSKLGDSTRCKQAADAPSPNSPFERMAAQSVAIAARRLGLHYLQRYFYLITFVCYLSNSSAREVSFARWMAERRELKHLLSTLTLEPAI